MKYTVVSYFVPAGSIRLRARSETKINELSCLLTDDIIWTGRPHLPFLRWEKLLSYLLGLLQLAFCLFVMRLPQGDMWLPELFGALMILIPLYSGLELMLTEYKITSEKILIISRLYRSIDEYDLSHFATRTDIFGNFGSLRQLPGTYYVQFLKCADGVGGARNWKRFMSVTKSDAKVIAEWLNKFACR
jgi:hypothetical protein